MLDRIFAKRPTNILYLPNVNILFLPAEIVDERKFGKHVIYNSNDDSDADGVHPDDDHSHDVSPTIIRPIVQEQTVRDCRGNLVAA